MTTKLIIIILNNQTQLYYMPTLFNLLLQNNVIINPIGISLNSRRSKDISIDYRAFYPVKHFRTIKILIIINIIIYY